MQASSLEIGLLFFTGDHSEWGVAGRFSLLMGEWTTLACGMGACGQGSGWSSDYGSNCEQDQAWAAIEGLA